MFYDQNSHPCQSTNTFFIELVEICRKLFSGLNRPIKLRTYERCHNRSCDLFSVWRLEIFPFPAFYLYFRSKNSLPSGFDHIYGLSGWEREDGEEGRGNRIPVRNPWSFPFSIHGYSRGFLRPTANLSSVVFRGPFGDICANIALFSKLLVFYFLVSFPDSSVLNS